MEARRLTRHGLFSVGIRAARARSGPHVGRRGSLVRKVSHGLILTTLALGLAVPPVVVAPLHALAVSAQSSWPADGTTTDVISGHNGTLQGGATYGAGAVGQPGDQSFSFPGPNSFISTDASVGNFGTDDATITFSINTTATTAPYMEIMSKRPICNYSSFWDVRMISGGKIFAEFDGSDTTNYEVITGTRLINDGAWHGVTLTRRGPKIALYVDGTPDGSATLPATANVSNAATMSFGQGPCVGAPDGTVNMVGRLDDISITQGPSAYPPDGGALTDPQTRGGGNACLACSSRHGHRILADPVNSATGNFVESQVDVAIAGRGSPLGFARSYNSTAAAISGPLGYGWQPNVGMSLAVSGSTATITQENGGQVTFTQSGSTWAPSAARFIASLTHNGDGTWTFVRQARDTYGFNAAGQLTSTTDLNGYKESYSYNASSQLSTITDNAGRTLTLIWSGSGAGATITEVDDANVSPTRKVTYQYNDGLGNLTDVIDVGGGQWHFTYDAGHRLTVMKDPKCQATLGCLGVQNHYDSSGRVDWQKDQLNRQTSFAYSGTPMNDAGGTTTITDPKGNVTVDAYRWGLLTSTTRGSGTSAAATTSYLYDAATLAPTSVTDPNGNARTMTYDSNGNLLTLKDALGNTTTNTYNGFNEVLTTKDPLLVTTTMVYDAKGNLSSVSRPLTGTSSTQTVTYNHANATFPGDLTSMVDPDNNIWSYGYDANGYRNAVTDPLGNKSTTVYNADGFMTSSVSSKGNVSGCRCAATYTTTYGRDSYGNLTTVTDPLSHQTIRHYDADQNLDSFTDGDANKTTYVYDLANQQTQLQRPDTTTLTTDYNLDGTVQDQKDGKNNAILTYGYDALARVSSMIDALNNATSYSYDGAGNRLTQQDPGGNCSATPKTGCTTFTYDVANQLKTVTYSDGVTPNVTNIAYDGDGQRTGMTDGTGTSAWVWDSLHRLSSYTNGAGAQVQYADNLRNLPTTITYPGSLNVTRGYDNAGRLTSVQDWLSNTTSFGYDVNSNLTTETLPAASGVLDTFTFDAADRLTAVSDKTAKTTLFAGTYTRDNANQLTSDSSIPSSTGSYQYDTLNQLCYAGSSTRNACSSPPKGAIAYSYDAADNLTQMGGTQQAFNNANELCWTATSSGSCASPPTGATAYTYDARGNRTKMTPPSGAATTLTYDQANRLTGYGTGASYAYNGDGLRMSKTVSGSTSQFLWDVAARLPLLLKDGSTSYVYGPGGLPLEQINASAALWFHHDQLGSTRLVTDSSGATQATYAFDPYGNLAAITGTITNPMQFGGQYFDSESGLYYLRARYYEPTTAQFMSRDFALSATRQPYQYASGSPLDLTDPAGLCDWNPLSGGFCGYQALSKTPMGKPLSQLLAADAAIVEYGHDHGVAGYGGCSPLAKLCYGASVQGGDVSVSGGGFGALAKGFFAGWASKKAKERHDTTAVCSVAVGIGVSVNVGASNPATGDLDWSDVEIDVFTGLGWQLGYNKSATLGHLDTPAH